MNRKDKIAVLIPCYNESKTIKKVVEDCMKKSRHCDLETTASEF